MKASILLLSVVISLSPVAIATPADNATGTDIINASLLIQNLPGQPKDLTTRFTALYLLGYLDGAIRADNWQAVAEGDGSPAVKLPTKANMVDLLREIQEFIGDSVVLRKALISRSIDP